MDKQKEQTIFEKLGLTKDEGTLYKVLLEGGNMPARNVATLSGISRTLTYKILEDLVNKGLVEKNEPTRGIARFSPIHPRELEKLVEEKYKEIDTLKNQFQGEIGSLVSLFNLSTGKPNVQFFEGTEGIQKVLDDTLTSNEPILSYADLEAIMKYIPEINKEYSNKREKLKIEKQGILLDTPKARELISDYHTQITETKFIKTSFPEFSSVMQIYDGKISYITLRENAMIGIIIEDKTIYEMHKVLFNSLWEMIK